MANTVMTAKNSFSEGLVMDFAPDNTQATTLTSALNATLLTFNGNEMSLLNDMGNGRVETAYLPEGYIPIGTCEFGDIIYIVSYNPLINKSLIGCFPSPERNISSEELGGLKSNLKSSDFQEVIISEATGFNTPTGRLVASSCKKILYLKELNPGDKYIISSTSLKNDRNTFSDYGNTSHAYGKFPKLLKVHVVAIEDSGKINYLDSTVKWYTDFFIAPNKLDSMLPDLDMYRTLTSSGYSTFQSKVSGKLALLIELEKINSFSCTYDIYVNPPKKPELEEGVARKIYDVYWSVSWGADDNNINPKYLVLTKAEWTGKTKEDAGKWFQYKKDSKNNYSINYKEGIHIDDFWKSLPIPFYDKTDTILSNYWYGNINRLYEPEIYPGTFQEFISTGSYQAKESAAINTLQDTYENLTMSKLTVARDNIGKPTNMYYINAHHSVGETYYTATSYGTYREITALEISDDMVNNYFNTLIYKHFSSFEIPFSQKFIDDDTILHPDISNLIYHYNITPAMPYGLLEEYTQDGYIDFSKIGTGEVKLTNWKYYNAENISTLTLGLEVYPEANKGIAEVAIDFYDNLGIAATYRINNKNSYSGLFTEYIPLNGEATTYKLSNINSEGITIYHAGVLATLINDVNIVFKDGTKNFKAYKKEDSYYYINEANEETLITDKSNIYVNDAGILYSNIVYLAKITVKYCSLDALGNFNIDNKSDFKKFYRWFWTNTIFNEYYYSIPDFDKLQAILDLDIAVSYNSNDRWKKVTEKYEPSTASSELEATKNLSSNVQAINQDQNSDNLGNLDATVTVGLQNTYNTFSLAESVGIENYLNNFNLSVVIGKSYIDNTIAEPLSVNMLENEFEESIYPTYDKSPDIIYNGIDNYGLLNPTETSDTLLKLLNSKLVGTGAELWEDAYKNYKNKYSLNFATTLTTTTYTNSLRYLSSSGEVVELPKYRAYNTKLTTSKIPLTFTGVYHSKYYMEYVTESLQLSTLASLVDTPDSLKRFGMKLTPEGNAVFENMITLAGGWHDTSSGHNNKKILAGVYVSDAAGKFSGSPSVFEGTWESTFKGGEGGYAITKNSKLWEKMWNIPILGETYLRDLLFTDIGLVLYCHGDEADNQLSFVQDYNHETPIDPSVYYSFRFGIVQNQYAPRYNTLIGRPGSKYMMGLVMKDINGEIHLLNNIFPVKNIGGTVTLIIDDLSDTSYIGNVILSLLSNLFVKLADKKIIDILRLSNVIYLTDNSSSFKKDIIYLVDIAEKVEHNKLILMLGMLFSDYITKIKSFISATTVDSNVNFIIQNILKNIPILLKFNYKQPSRIIPNIQTSVMAVRLGENDYYTVIPEIEETSKLYTIDRSDKNNLVMKAANSTIVPSIVKITAAESGRLLYTYASYFDHNPKFYSMYTYKDDHLRLSKTAYNSSDMFAMYLQNSRCVIGGIVKDEYITTNLKYVDYNM